MKNHNCIIPFIFSTLLEVTKKIYFIWITWLIMYHIFITFIIVSGYSHVWKRLLMVPGRMFISWTKYFNHCCFFFFRKENHHKNIVYNTLLLNLVCTGPLGKALNFHLNCMFCLVSFHSVAYFLDFLETFTKSLPW